MRRPFKKVEMRDGEGATTETYAVVRRREECPRQRSRSAFFSGLLGDVSAAAGPQPPAMAAVLEASSSSLERLAGDGAEDIAPPKVVQRLVPALEPVAAPAPPSSHDCPRASDGPADRYERGPQVDGHHTVPMHVESLCTLSMHVECRPARALRALASTLLGIPAQFTVAGHDDRLVTSSAGPRTVTKGARPCC